MASDSVSKDEVEKKLRRYLELVAGVADIRQQLVSGVLDLDSALKKLSDLKSVYWNS